MASPRQNALNFCSKLPKKFEHEQSTLEAEEQRDGWISKLLLILLKNGQFVFSEDELNVRCSSDFGI